MKEKSKYDIQAEKFLEKTGTTIDVKFLKHDKHFDDDKHKRDIYQVELKRKRRSMAIVFGNSMNDSAYYQDKQIKERTYHSDGSCRTGNYKVDRPIYLDDYCVKVPGIPPTAYSILACLTKDDPRTFEDFCSEFGYDTDSKKAEKTYNAVKEEWLKVCSLFSDEELSELQEIS